ncbi:MAG: nucleotide sugar dehydrogenase [Burkholderiales bacterium]
MSRPVIGFAGMTHLGINYAAASAARGFSTVCFESDAELIGNLQAGRLPVVEPGLPELIAHNRKRLMFSARGEALNQCDLVYIASDVPTDGMGASDLSGISALIARVRSYMNPSAVLIVLCQVPPGYTRAVQWPAEQLYYQVETLIFGRAVERAMQPERFIVGCADPSHALPPTFTKFLAAFGCPVLPMRYESAELAKIAINCCLVASVTVANTLAELSERIGADWHEIVPALKLDKRIGEYSYLAPGLGLAGGNLERDLATVMRLSHETGSEAGLIRSFIDNSRHRKDWVLRTVHDEILARERDPVIGILGLAYKENTHSTKNSPALELIRHLKHVRLRLHDPVVAASAAQHAAAVACTSPLDAATGVDALVVMTPWPQFRELKSEELKRVMKGRLVLDPMRVLDSKALASAGFDYLTIGMPPARSTKVRDSHA